jgi:signal transduction histidine kinase
MITRFRELQQTVGSKWLVYSPGYAWFIPLWLIGSIVGTPVEGGVLNLLGLLSINIIAIGVCCLEYFALRHTLWRKALRDNRGPVPLSLVLAGGAILGTSKTLLGVFLSNVFIGQDLELNFPRVFIGTVLGMAMVIVIPIVLTQLEFYRTQRAELIAAIVHQEESHFPQGHLNIHPHGDSSSLGEFKKRALAALDSAEQQPEKLPDVLDNLRTADIRPWSHNVWQNESRRITDFTLSSILRISMSRINFVILPVIISFVVILGPSAITSYGVADGLIAIGLEVLIITLFLGIARKLPRKGTAWGVGVFVTTCVAITAVIGILITALLGPVPSLSPFQSYLSLFLVIALLVLFTSVFNVADKMRKLVQHDLTEVKSTGGYTELQRVQNIKEDRNLAQLLHSQVQNTFLARSIDVRTQLTSGHLNSEEQTTLLNNTITQLKSYIETLGDPKIREQSTLRDALKQLTNTWELTLEVTTIVTPSIDDSVFTPHVHYINLVLAEALTNSAKHGFAHKVRIIISASKNSLSIDVEDDGLGPRNGQPGLGTHLFMSMPNASWSLMRSATLGGAQLHVEFPLET